MACSRLVLGNHADFQVEPIGAPALAWLPLFVVFGLLTGCLGAVYNRLVLWFLDHVAAIRRIPSLAKAATIGAIIGLAMFVYPLAVGGGEDLTQRILGGQHIVLSVIIGILAVRFVAGPLSYSAAVPGGLFAPLLAVGALWGLAVRRRLQRAYGPETQRSWRFRWRSSEWRHSSGPLCARR